MTKVAVYGTLKKGHPNQRVMERAKGKYLGRCRLDNWDMVNLGPFPAITPGNRSVEVEVYGVEDIEPLDILEGYPHFYDRTEVKTEFGSAWVYFQDNITGEVIEDGVW